MEKTKQQQGFTLLELLVTIVIAAIIAAIAIPALQTTIINNRVEATANDLRNMFIRKRNQAISNGQPRLITNAMATTDIADKYNDIVIKRNDGASSTIIIAADGAVDSTDLVHIGFSVCYTGNNSKIRNKAVVLFPSGLASIKDATQLLANDNDESVAQQKIDC